jgi:CheY-like chemotaxis protein
MGVIVTDGPAAVQSRHRRSPEIHGGVTIPGAAHIGHHRSQAQLRQVPMPTILVIDPDPDSMEILHALLRFHGFDVLVCREPSAGIAVALEARPAAIVSDVFVRTASGWAILEYLKANARTADIPVMVVTAYATADDEDRARRAGADRFLTKPFRAMEVIEVLTELLSRGPAHPDEVRPRGGEDANS